MLCPVAPISPNKYRQAAVVAALGQGMIVLTGAGVRLTDSGLGCENWPKCTEERLVPELGIHPWIEFGNRLLTFVLVATVAAAVSFAYRRRPRRPDLIRWAWGLVAGLVAQIVLGGVTVLVDLHPLFVGGHYFLSVVLLWNAVVLVTRASAGGPETTPNVDRGLIMHGRAVVSLAVVVLAIGTLVTGTGPNSGDGRAERLTFDLNDIARIHAIAVWCFLAVTLVLAIRLQRRSTKHAVLARWLVGGIIVQGAIGYTQFALGVPPLLVEAHMAGTVYVWCVTLVLYLSFYDRPVMEPADPLESGPPVGETADDEVTSGPDLAKMES